MNSSRTYNINDKSVKQEETQFLHNDQKIASKVNAIKLASIGTQKMSAQSEWTRRFLFIYPRIRPHACANEAKRSEKITM